MHGAADPTTRHIRTITVRASKLDVADERRLTGYAIVFNSLSEDLGGWKEIIAPEAVDRTLRSGENVDALIDHRRETTTVLGSTDSGLLSMRKDRHGLKVEITPPDTTHARDVLTNVRAGLVKGMSFAFRVWPEGATWDQNDDGLFIRTVTDMTFDEVSIVLNPAYTETEINARARDFDRETLQAFQRTIRWKPSAQFRMREIRAGLR